MADVSPFSWWRRFLALPNDSRIKTLGVAFLVALISAITVSVTSVTLKPRQQAHIDAAREANLAAMMATLPGLADILRETGADTLETVIVDLEAGQIDGTVDAASYDFLAHKPIRAKAPPSCQRMTSLRLVSVQTLHQFICCVGQMGWPLWCCRFMGRDINQRSAPTLR